MYVPGENGRAENDAEHSWSLALMVVLLAPKLDPKIDINKAVTYAVIHDICEVYAGDTSVWASPASRRSKANREKAATQKMAKHFSGYANFIDMIKKYEKKVDPEARFVYALDKFHNWFTAYCGGEYYYRNYNKITYEQAMTMLDSYRPKARTHPVIGLYFDQLVEAFGDHPEYFYNESKL